MLEGASMATALNKYDNVAVLVVKDDLAGTGLDSFNVRAEQCMAEGFHCIVVDCTSVAGVESAGLEALLNLQDHCEGELGSVKLCGLDETLQKILEITRLKRRFEVFSDLEAAVRSYA